MAPRLIRSENDTHTNWKQRHRKFCLFECLNTQPYTGSDSMYSHNKNSQPSLYRINDALINATNLVDFFFTIIYYLIVHKGISYKGNYASILINYMREISIQ